MRKPVALLVGAGLLTVAAAGFAASQARTPKVKMSRTKVTEAMPKIAQKNAPKALVTLDYVDAGGTFYLWNGTFYMSNVFKPGATDYPLQVVALDVYYTGLDDLTTGAGVIDGVRVFDPAGAILATELNIAATIDAWTNVPITSPPTIAAGNFVAGGFNNYVSAADYNDAMLQGSAINWTAPPDEPFVAVNGGASAAAAGPWTVSAAGATYTTVSAATVVATINTNVPVELMRFAAE